MNLQEISQQLTRMSESIILVFAFNGTGKTQLSVAYKNETKGSNNGKHAGVYYNAYSEDLFVWDNDEDNGGDNIRLKILPSSLNKFHSFLYENENLILDKLSAYNPQYRYRLNPYNDVEKGIESVTFFVEGADDVPIKISRGEERIFVWCFFLGLLEVDGWSDVQNAHIFIDDPVSSLDEHNIFITADTLFKQIENHYLRKKIIITTHHIGLFSILATRLTKGEKSDRYKNLTELRILKRIGEELSLETPQKNVFLYHLHLLQVLEEAKNTQLYTYHFALLRQLLENVASFLGTGKISHTLHLIGIDDVDKAVNVVHTHSHKDAYYSQTEMMNPADQNFFHDIFEKLKAKYQFVFHAS